MATYLDEIKGRLSADEQKLLDSVIAKEPEIREGILRQSDYSRKMNELRAEKTKYDEAQEYNERMKAWADENVPRYESLVEKGLIDADGNELWSTQKSELEKQLEEARKAAVGGEMDPKELDKRVQEIVKANGGVTPEELKALVASEAKKLAEATFTEQWTGKEKKFNEETIPFVAGFATAASVVALQYQQETGEKWTSEKQKELYALMAKEQNFDPYAVGEKMMAPAREKKEREAMIQEEVNKRVAAIRAAGGGGDGDFDPTPNGPKGSLQLALERSTSEGDFEAQIRARTVEAAKALRAEGK